MSTATASTIERAIEKEGSNVTQLHSNHWIETVSGKKVDFIDPKPESIDINDIAWALSRQARFVGHTKDDQLYNVASHSVWVANILFELYDDPIIALHGLLHDAHEAYTGDIPAPMKSIPSLKWEIEAVQTRLQIAIYKALDIEALTPETADMVREADEAALAWEAYHHTTNRGKSWADPIPSYANDIHPQAPESNMVAWNNFMFVYRTLVTLIKQNH